MKKSIFLFFAAILCSVSAWADVTWKGGYFYFDNSLGVNKGYVMLCGRRHKENGKDNWYTAVTQFNKTAIDGTKLYYTKTLEGSTWSTSTWNGWAVISDANKWNNGNFDGWSGAGWCSAYRSDQSFNGTSTYLLIPTSTAKSKTINVDTYSDYKGLNKSQTLYKYTSTDNGTSYSEVSINSGTVTISAYKMTGNGTASNDGNTATIDASSTSTSIDAVYTSEVTLTAQANDGYKFNGWYDVETGGTALSTNTSYTYTAANETKTIYARFIQTAEETHDVTVSYMCGSESIKAAETVTKVGEEITTKVTAATIPFYTFSGWELGTGVTSTDDLSASSINIKTLSTGDYTLTANYTAIPTSTVYLVNNSDWTKVYAYGWDGTKGETPAWPGAEITANKLAEKYEGYDVYSYKVEVGSYGKVIFNNGSGKQTATFDWTDGKYYYAVDPLGSNVFLAGDMNEWNGSADELKKETKESTTASIKVNLTAKTYEFKLVIDGAWKANTGTMQRGGNGVHEGGWSFDKDGYDDKCKLVADFAGDYTFTWDLTTKKLTVAYPELPTYTVTATAENGTVTGAGEYKHGTEATLVATPNAGYAFVNWKKGEEVVSSEASYTFTVTANTDLVATFAPEETHEVTVSYICNSNPIPGHVATTLAVGVTTPSTITAPAITNYKFDSWTLGSGVQAVDDKANPIQITTLAEGEYTLVANYTKIELTYTVKVPEGTEKCYIAGEMNSWSFQEMTPTANANEFTITIDGATADHKYKYACGDGWAYVEKNADGTDLAENRTYSANDVVAKWAEPAKCYLMGIGGDWTTGIEMKEDGDQFKLLCQPIAEGEQFKFKHGDTWSDGVANHDFPGIKWVDDDNDGNSNITLPAGNYNFYYKKNENKVYIEAATDCETTEEKTIFIEEGLEYSVNGTTVTITGLYNDELFELKISDCDINNLEDQICPITMSIGEFGANGYVENQNATVAVWFSGYIQVTATGLQDYDNSNITYNIDITAAPPAEEGLSEINVEVYDAVCTIDEDNMLTMLSTTAGVQVNVYNFDRTVAMAEYDYELFTYDGMASGKTNVAIDGNTVSIYVVTTGEDNDGNEIPVIAYVSGELPAAEEEDPTQSQEVDIMVTDLVVEDNVVMGTGSNFTFVLTLVDYAGEDGTYVLSDESFVRSGMSLRGYAATGSLTKAVDEYYGTYFMGTIQATVGETPFTFNLTMVSEVTKEENITAAATVTYNEENDVVFSANWNGTPISITLEGFENVAEKQYGELTLSIGTGEDEFYAFGEPIAYVNGKEISIEGEFYSYITETTYNVALWGTLPVEETPDYTRSVTPGHYGTICLPYASSNYTGMELYEVSWLQKNGETPVNLYLDQLAADAQLEAGKPYIFRATSTELTVTYTGAPADAPIPGENGLTGSFAAIPAGGVLTGNYVVAQTKFWTATADAYAAANRAYIDKAKVPYTEQKQIPGRRRVALGTSGENAETGIDNIITTDTPVKVIENGQLIIIRNGEKFNVQGQKL